MISPHEKTAQLNHCQSLERLAERQGVDPMEAVAILEDIDYRKRWPIPNSIPIYNDEAEKRLLELVAKYINEN